MNVKILQKCVDELAKDDFKKEYVLGMLETLIIIGDNSLQPGKQIIYDKPIPSNLPISTEPVEHDEVPSFLRAGPIGKI